MKGLSDRRSLVLLRDVAVIFHVILSSVICVVGLLLWSLCFFQPLQTRRENTSLIIIIHNDKMLQSAHTV